MAAIKLEDLRRYAIARSLFPPTTLQRAIRRLGFVQADPIRAPARAQDLILRHRVKGYRIDDLELKYPKLAVDEDYFVNYGFLPVDHLDYFHPRTIVPSITAINQRRVEDLLEYARQKGEVHPRDVTAHFAHGRVTNYWGGASSASTHLLDRMHYQGLLRIARRENGVRVYAPRDRAVANPEGPDRQAQADALLQLVVHLYAPLPAAGLGLLVGKLRSGAPHLKAELKVSLSRIAELCVRAEISNTVWHWPLGETPDSREWEVRPVARLLAPFDPVVWDRNRFAQFWGWEYRFEAYTPKAKRKLGYYALPLLWLDEVIGWANIGIKREKMIAKLGYISGSEPSDGRFRGELSAELGRMEAFLRLDGSRALVSGSAG